MGLAENALPYHQAPISNSLSQTTSTIDILLGLFKYVLP